MIGGWLRARPVRQVGRASSVLAAVLVLTSCGREVPFRFGPAMLIGDLAWLEVRVWNSASCPASADVAADPSTINQVVVQEFFNGIRDQRPVGRVPPGAHAVSIVARNDTCQVVLFGCSPNIDFSTAAAVNITWAHVDSGPACVPGFVCGGGVCYEPRDDAGTPRDAR